MRFYTVRGGGHQVPGRKGLELERALGPLINDIDAAEEAWRFFSRFQR